MILFSEAMPAIKNRDTEFDQVLLGPVKAIPSGHTCWDKIVIQGPKTIQEIFSEIYQFYGVKLMMLIVDEMLLFSEGMSSPTRLELTIEELYK
mmetsp:Transcript_17161/g.15050  ORF Transcript_17161/g.15050 Transcript_17161/m.15050 type:complete len:93 (-) Transcript_17161:18-296(-)